MMGNGPAGVVCKLLKHSTTVVPWHWKVLGTIGYSGVCHTVQDITTRRAGAAKVSCSAGDSHHLIPWHIVSEGRQTRTYL